MHSLGDAFFSLFEKLLQCPGIWIFVLFNLTHARWGSKPLPGEAVDIRKSCHPGTKWLQEWMVLNVQLQAETL